MSAPYPQGTITRRAVLTVTPTPPAGGLAYRVIADSGAWQPSESTDGAGSTTPFQPTELRWTPVDSRFTTCRLVVRLRP